jgi:hypothetical protein
MGGIGKAMGYVVMEESIDDLMVRGKPTRPKMPP